MKPKILRMSSESYPEGRLDSFRIDESDGNWESIVDCLVDFGFEYTSIRADIDIALEDEDIFFFTSTQN